MGGGGITRIATAVATGGISEAVRAADKGLGFQKARRAKRELSDQERVLQEQQDAAKAVQQKKLKRRQAFQESLTQTGQGFETAGATTGRGLFGN